MFSVTEVAVKLALFNYVTFSNEYDQEVKMEYEHAINSSFSLEDHWTQKSCPEIHLYDHAFDDNERYCELGHSFYGMNVNYKCPSNMSPNLQSAECRYDVKQDEYYWHIVRSVNCSGCVPPTEAYAGIETQDLSCSYIWAPWQDWG